jgi:transposase
MAHSIDFRMRVMAYMDEGHTFAELKEAFKVYPATYYQWRALLQESGELTPRPIPGRPPAIDTDLLKETVDRAPDSYPWELAEPFGVSATAVFYAPRNMKYPS